VIDKDGHIVTNFHVVEGAEKIQVGFSNRETVEATLVGSDAATDLALLEVDLPAQAFAPLALADSDALKVGEPVVAIGNPFGLERTVTAGIVSALQRAVTSPSGSTIDHVIQTDAPINHGNSGGPLLDSLGRVIGVNSQIETGGAGDGNVGIGFAVPSNTVKTVVAQLLATGKVQRAFLGVAARPVEPELARTYNLPVDSGLLVETVTPATGAAQAGLEAGDEDVVVEGQSYRLGGDLIVAADGARVSTIADLRDAVTAHKPGERMKLEIYRDGVKRTVTVTLGRQPTTQ
jgi:S1-C subfamily serine protease